MEGAQDPAIAIENLRGALTSALGVAVAVGEAVGGGIGGGWANWRLTRCVASGRPRLAVAGAVSEQRRFATVVAPLSDLKAVRQEHHHTINDVVLAMISGGLRSWLLTRGESISPGRC